MSRSDLEASSRHGNKATATGLSILSGVGSLLATLYALGTLWMSFGSSEVFRSLMIGGFGGIALAFVITSHLDSRDGNK